jgi:hypothetical protein
MVSRLYDEIPPPLTGWPVEVTEELGNWLEEIIEDETVSAFYIGRGVDLAQRMSAHGAHEILALYRTDSADHAIEVEDALLQTYFHHEKNENEASDGRGGRSEEYVNYVYVAVWFD